MAQSDITRSTPEWTGRPLPDESPRSDELARVELVTEVEGIRALTPDYLHLYQATRNTLPYATQEWHLAWCEHLLSRNPHMHQQPMFCVVREHEGRCVAIVPLILTRRRLGPLKVAAFAMVGADPALTELRNPLIEPGYERAAVRAVHERLAALPGWDWIQWNGVSAELAAALAREAAPQWYQTLDDYVLDLPSAWPELMAGLSHNMRKTVRRSYDLLARDGHAFEFVAARDCVEVRWAVLRFLELHSLRAGMPGRSLHPNRFAARSPRAFLYEVCERLAARDAVRVFQLWVADQAVASRIGFVMGDSLYLYHSGFDPAWAPYSVMTTMMAEVMRYAIATGLKSVNLSLVAEPSKLRWRPRRVDFYSALVHRESLRSRFACGAYRLAVSANSGPRRLLRRLLQARRDWN
ncbi:MAG: GNAT family N-acetyltransferase [Gammaproteobacteria bacterium]|nr:GNAT family N-acetyltransferase [Gammaproteobacteria bacterium]